MNNVADSNEKHNIESESEKSVVINESSQKKKKWLNRALFTVSAKHVTLKRELK